MKVSGIWLVVMIVLLAVVAMALTVPGCGLVDGAGMMVEGAGRDVQAVSAWGQQVIDDHADGQSARQHRAAK